MKSENVPKGFCRKKARFAGDHRDILNSHTHPSVSERNVPKGFCRKKIWIPANLRDVLNNHTHHSVSETNFRSSAIKTTPGTYNLGWHRYKVVRKATCVYGVGSANDPP
jgi:hypothetical protein